MDNFKQAAQQDNNTICAYVYGSHVYGTNHKDSDFDFICVVKDKTQDSPLAQFGDVTTYTTDEFQQLVTNHEISALECVFLKDEFKLKEEHQFTFELNKQVLRNAISAKASNSWVKCKKKFIVEQDFNPYIGKKSAWHSLRIFDFGTQIAINGKITDYGSMNSVMPDIMQLGSWAEIDAGFRKFHNETASKFKAVAPKEEVVAQKKLM
jgi:predicted nucleotidyltransferase